MALDPQTYEAKWRNRWRDNGTYRVDNPQPGQPQRPGYYVLDMFPYPSGAGLHVGHPLGYIASDIYARYKRMSGFHVLHPMGFDSFGLPAEQYAIEKGIHPAVTTEANMARYREQFDLIGFSFDWSREVRTSDPAYYKWTQWALARMFESYYDLRADAARPVADLAAAFAKTGATGVHAACNQNHEFSAAAWRGFTRKRQADILMDYRIAYRRETFVNWCEALATVLANDEIKDGVSERGGHPVERRPMLQWCLRTSAYAQRLLDDLEGLDWTDSLKAQQRNWIGRSTGAHIRFAVEGSDAAVEVYTTRPDTIFGATFMVLAPEHPLLEMIVGDTERAAVTAYQDRAAGRSDIERQADVKEVSGEFTGAFAQNPLSGRRLPIYIAEYVLMDYGTGAIMAVPSDDERDERFAKHFGLDIVRVVNRPEGVKASDKAGTIINSGLLDGLEVSEAIPAAIAEVERLGVGEGTVAYRLRDANFSRQRYWGEPFPIIYDEEGIASRVPDEDLPVVLPPLDDFKPASSGAGPLSRAKEWLHEVPGHTRETDTMPAVAGSSWYFLRFMDPHNEAALADRDVMAYWGSVDLYVGGTEHAVSHLLYARFWQKFLFDLGVVPVAEPFQKLINQGMIQAIEETLYLHKADKYFASAELVTEQNSDDFARIFVSVDLVSDYGFDDRPSYLSATQIEQFRQWRPDFATTEFRFGESGDKFLTHSELGKMSKSRHNVVNPDDIIARYGADCFRMYEMFLGPIEQHKPWNVNGIEGVAKFLRRFYSLYFDEQDQLAVTDLDPTEAQLKTLHGTIKKVHEDIERFSMNTCISSFMICVNDLRASSCSSRSILEPLARLIAPFAPFLSEEIWSQLGHETSVHTADYPQHEERYLVESEIEYPISVNGKKRLTANFPAEADATTLEAEAKALEALQPYLAGGEIKKVIVVPGRMINFVVG